MGYLNVDYILSVMPELDGVKAELQEFEGQLITQIQVKYDALQKKMASYQQEAESLNEVVRLDRQREIQNLESGLQSFRADAQQAVTRKEGELLQPLYDKIQEAIDSVSTQNGFDHIFRQEAIVFSSKAENIAPLVLKQLKIDIPEG